MENLWERFKKKVQPIIPRDVVELSQRKLQSKVISLKLAFIFQFQAFATFFGKILISFECVNGNRDSRAEFAGSEFRGSRHRANGLLFKPSFL